MGGRSVRIQALYGRTSSRDRSTCELIFRILELIVQWETSSIAQTSKDISIVRMRVSSYIRIWITVTFSMRLHDLNIYSFLVLLRTLSAVYISNLLSKKMKKKIRSIHSFVDPFHVLCFQEPDQKWNITAIFVLELHNFHFPVWRISKSYKRSFAKKTNCTLHNLFFTDAVLKSCDYTAVSFVSGVQISAIHRSHQFELMFIEASTEVNHPHFSRR